MSTQSSTERPLPPAAWLQFIEQMSLNPMGVKALRAQRRFEQRFLSSASPKPRRLSLLVGFAPWIALASWETRLGNQSHLVLPCSTKLVTWHGNSRLLWFPSRVSHEANAVQGAKPTISDRRRGLGDADDGNFCSSRLCALNALTPMGFRLICSKNSSQAARGNGLSVELCVDMGKPQ